MLLLGSSLTIYCTRNTTGITWFATSCRRQVIEHILQMMQRPMLSKLYRWVISLVLCIWHQSSCMTVFQVMPMLQQGLQFDPSLTICGTCRDTSMLAYNINYISLYLRRCWWPEESSNCSFLLWAVHFECNRQENRQVECGYSWTCS